MAQYDVTVSIHETLTEDQVDTVTLVIGDIVKIKNRAAAGEGDLWYTVGAPAKTGAHAARPAATPTVGGEDTHHLAPGETDVVDIEYSANEVKLISDAAVPYSVEGF